MSEVIQVTVPTSNNGTPSLNTALKTLSQLMNDCYTGRWQELIAEVKASGADEATQAEIIAVADKSISAELKRNADINALLAKYCVSGNIPAADDSEDDYY